MDKINNQKSELSITLKDRGIDESTWSAILSSVFPSAKEESALMAVDYCKARGLDIMKKPCHIVPMNVKNAVTGKYEWRDVIMPGIAEQRITASRTGEYVGQDPAVYGDTVDVKIGGQTHSVPEWCCITVYRLIGSERVGFSHTEYFEEACGTVKDGNLNSMWKKRKRGQLAKCAEAGALRKAFPEELGGMNTADEMEGQHEVKLSPRNVTPMSEPIDPFKKEIPAVSDKVEAKKPEASSTAESEKPAKKPEGTRGEVVIDSYEEKSGKTNGKDWKFHIVTMTSVGKGNKLEATTFSNTIGGIAEFNVGSRAMATLKKGEKGLEMTALEVLPEVLAASTNVEGSLC